MLRFPIKRLLRGLPTFMACVTIVMLGGTRIIDFGSYEDAYTSMRVAAFLNAEQDWNFITGFGCPQASGHDCGAVYTKYGFDNCPGISSESTASVRAAYDAGDLPTLPRNHMPLEYRVVFQLHSEPGQTMSLPLYPHDVADWLRDVPTPPPRAL